MAAELSVTNHVGFSSLSEALAFTEAFDVLCEG